MSRIRFWTGCFLLGLWIPIPPVCLAAARQTPSPAKIALPPIEARVVLDTGWQFPLVHVREPVTYRLQIDRAPQVQILPESITPEALRRLLVRTTTLPPELFQIVETAKHTEQLPEERLRETVDFSIRFSKPGIYSLPALQVAYSTDKSRSTPQTLQSPAPQALVLTVDAHMPAGAGALPGDILAPPRLVRQPWFWLRYLALGVLMSGALAVVLGMLWRTPRPAPSPRQKRPSPQQLRTKYQAQWQRLCDRTPTLSGPLAPDARAWLRDAATLVRRVLGDCASGDAASLAGGAGSSAAMITAHLHITTPQQEAILQPILQLLHELDTLSAAPAALLTADDYRRWREAIQHSILQLTTHEATRVFRTPSRL